jgi:hypothetical protein
MTGSPTASITSEAIALRVKNANSTHRKQFQKIENGRFDKVTGMLVQLTDISGG